MRKAAFLGLFLSVLCACLGGGRGGGGSSSSSTGAGAPAPQAIQPGNPGPGDVTFTIDATKTRPISPWIYGMNHHQFSSAPWNLTLSRAGGNRWTAYNWENNASNAGSDWYHQNDGYLGGGDTPGEAVRPQIQNAHNANAAIIVTVPIVGYVAADKNGGGDVANTPNYLQTRFKVSVPKKNAAFTMTPSTSDGYVYQDEFVWFLKQKFPYAWSDAKKKIFFSLDNEPDLWSETHARIHPNKVKYSEIVQRTVDYAKAIKDVIPQAETFGPVNYGWQGMVNLQNAPDANGDFLNYLLAQMKSAEAAHGKRLLDVLDIHWYPEARGGGVRVTEDNSDPAVAAARIQAPRSLWDPNYTEDSWIAQWSTNGPIKLLPRLKQKIDTYYPGTKLAITEYYYGGGNHISGGIAQADVLGILGREGVYAATLWRLGSTNHSFIYAGFNMFRNYDGANGAFGNTSLSASTTNVAASSVYASVDAGNPNRMVLVVINKSSAAQKAAISVTHTVKFSRAEVYQLTSASSTISKKADIALTATNAFVYTMPGMSVTTLVLKP